MDARTAEGPVDGDFYRIAQLVSPLDQALLARVRAFAEEKVAPIINLSRVPDADWYSSVNNLAASVTDAAMAAS